jgi:hypothetical protein
MEWKVLSERVLYQDPWVHVGSADVELPDGRHLDHRIVHTAAGAGAVVTDEDRILLIWRHRFITSTWTWEVPLGASNLVRNRRRPQRERSKRRPGGAPARWDFRARDDRVPTCRMGPHR